MYIVVIDLMGPLALTYCQPIPYSIFVLITFNDTIIVGVLAVYSIPLSMQPKMKTGLGNY